MFIKNRKNKQKYKSLQEISAFPFRWVLLFFVGYVVLIYGALLMPGAIIFSDLDFGFRAQGYLERITGVWNDYWSTTTLFNSSRLYAVFPAFFISFLFGHAAGILQKALFVFVMLSSATSMAYAVYSLLRSMHRTLPLRVTQKQVVFASIVAGVLYMSNPWFLMRIQHLYLLVGYALTPLVCAGMFLLGEQVLQQASVYKKTYKALTQKGTRKLEPLLHVTPRTLGLILLTAGAWAIASASVHYFFFLFGLFSAWCVWLLVYILLQRRRILAAYVVGIYIAVGLVFFALIAFWLLPQAGFNLTGSISPTNVNTLDSLAMLSRNISFTHVLYGVSYWWGFFDYEILTWTFWAGGGIVLFIGFVGIKRLWDYRIAFLFAGYVSSFLLAMGPKSIFGGAFVHIIFSWSFAEKIGFLLRDPDKLVGITLFFLSMLVGVGMAHTLEYINVVRAAARGKVFPGLMRWQFIFGCLFCGVFIAGLYAYIHPVQQLYLAHFLTPTKPPEAYIQTQKEIEEQLEPGERWMSVPRYEEITSPGESFAVATWNDVDPSRPTSSVDLWSLPHKTYHPLESAYYRVKHFYHLVTDFLAKEGSDRIGDIVDDTGARMLVHHNDILMRDGEGTQKGWEAQGHLQKNTPHEFMQTALLPQNSRIGETFSRLLYSSHNYIALDRYAFDPSINTRSTVPFFYEQLAHLYDEAFFTSDDVLDEDNAENFILSTVSAQYHHSPTQNIDRGDPFIGWAATNTSQADWRWHTRQVGLREAGYEFDRGEGIVFTRAARALDHSPLEEMPQGETIINMDQVVADENFFKLYAAEEVEIRKEPLSHYDNLPSYKMSLAASPEEAAHLVSTQRIQAIERSIYRFDMVMSGVDTRFLHAKVIYYDAHGQQVGVGYAASPEHTGTFQALKFYGLFVTPADTEEMEIQMWSTQRPEKKTYWWVHDFVLSSMDQYATDSAVSVPFTLKESGEYYVFARTLRSWAGGRLTYTFDDASEHSTLHTTLEKDALKGISVLHDDALHYTREGLHGENAFEWQPLGEHALERGEHQITFNNLDGFNALADVVVIPKKVYDLHAKKSRERVKRMQQHITLEGEIDFMIDGANIQFSEGRSNFSQGHALYLNAGTLTHRVEIFEDGKYTARIFVGDTEIRGETEINVTFEHERKDIVRSYTDVLTTKDDDGQIVIPDIALDEGYYTVEISVQDHYPTETDITDLHQIGMDEILDLDPFLGHAPELQCCYCQKILPEHTTLALDGEEAAFSVAPGHSCDWAIVASDKVDTETGEEWLISYDVAARYARLGHAKIVFLDEDDVIVDVQFIRKTQVGDTYDWRNAQTLVAAPGGAHKMQLQWWVRQNPVQIGTLSLRDLIIKPYRSLPHIDLVTVTEETQVQQTPAYPLKGDFAGTRRTIQHMGDTQSKEKIRGIKMFETYQPLWMLTTEKGDAHAIPLYGFLGGYLFTTPEPANQDITMTYSLGMNRWLYVCGVGIWSIFVGLLLWRFLWMGVLAKNK